jgi:hypothetical protein
MSEHDKIRSRCSAVIEKLEKIATGHGDLDLDATRIALALAESELQIAQDLLRREFIARDQKN